MSPGTAYAVWIIGETIMVAAGIFALTVIIRDVRTAWPRIVAIMKGDENDDAR